MQGMPGFDAYSSEPSMYQVHKFMALDPYQVGYFITQVGLAAASFGVADADVQAVGMALTSLFDYKCAPPTTAVKAQGPELQSICIDEACPLAMDAVCDKYEKVIEPQAASSMNGSMTMTMSMPPAGTGSMTMTMPSGTASMTSTMMAPTAGAVANGINLAAIAGGMAALLI